MAHLVPRSFATARSRVRMRRVTGPPYRAVTSGWAGSDMVISFRALEAGVALVGSRRGPRILFRWSHRRPAPRQRSVQDFTPSPRSPAAVQLADEGAQPRL